MPAITAGIKKRVYPHLPQHFIATILLDSGLGPIDQLQKFLRHLDLSTTQIYAETNLRALGDNYIRALVPYFAGIWAFAS
jgi:integrase/recombinase XerD